MIEIKNIQNKNEYSLFIDRELIEEIDVDYLKSDKYGLRLERSDVSKVDEIIESILLEDIPPSVAFFWAYNYHLEDVSIEFLVDFEDRVIQVQLSFFLDIWNYVYSFKFYYDKVSEILKDKISSISLNNEDLLPGEVKIDIVFLTNKNESNLFRRFIVYKELFIETHKKIISEFSNQEKVNSSNIKFEFPQEVKTLCQQYLIYFTTFLADIGIKASTDLSESTGKILFSVMPTDENEGLDKIREALAIYLNLPSSPIVYDDSFAAIRLQQQVENLQHSQKMAVSEIRIKQRELQLAQNVIESQDKIINQKDTTIEQQNRIIEKIESKSIMMDSLVNKEELEEVYDGLKIGESDFLKKQLGIHLNPAKLIKSAVKNTFGKCDKDKSVLDLNDDE